MKMGHKTISELPKVYKSVDITATGPSIVEHRFPPLDEHTVVVEPKLAGICRSDIKEITGTRTVRHDFGHEIVGAVRWAGKARGLSAGDTVCLDPHVNIDRNSGFSEYIIARGEARELGRAFVKLPADIPADRAVFCEPMACAQHCVANLLRYLGDESLAGRRVAVIGAGNAGVLIGLIAKHNGASLTLFNRGCERLEFLRERKIFSRGELCLMEDHPPAVFDAAVVATTFLNPSVMAFAPQCLRDGAVLMLYGGTRAGDSLADTGLDIDRTRRNQLLAEATCGSKRIRVGGTYGALAEDFTAVIEMLRGGGESFPLELLISRKILLEDLPATLDTLAATEKSYCGKIVVGLT